MATICGSAGALKFDLTRVTTSADTLVEKTVGFISNGKEGTKGFFAHLERILRDEFAVADVVTRVKSNFSAPADPHIVAEIGSWDAVVTGVGD